ncbi:hypothetical protein [Robertmurraya andreesenii]|uniref:Methionine-rich copper-binding protein CopC n=1 Tax=Anoxybacillus andreesenii TaxID=1325932 RepID=A0ABT9UZY1_9BACL|nr:hypothetical protein [Robertmurraya andreesenii]MDQ0154249.1 methionine-rich copper-binding protein CopC [Robertmurraya andreesenii]
MGENDKIELSEDGKSVLVTLNTKVDNQATKELSIKNVKTTAGKTVADYKTDIKFSDFVAPTLDKVVSVGPDKFKLVFNEPVDETSAQTVANYSINNGQYFIKSATVTNLNEVQVELYSTLADGEYDIKVKDVKDLAGFKIAETTLKLTQKADTEAPFVAKVTEATPNKVVLEFNEDIILNDTVDNLKSKIYHTNSSNKPSNITIDGKKMTLTFADAQALPRSGTAHLVIEKDVVKDGWNNKNAKYEANITVVVDVTKPTVAKLEAPKDNQLKVTYSEDVTNSATTAANYTLLNSEGKKVDGVTLDPKFEVKDGKTSAHVVLIDLSKSIPGGTYTLVAEKVKDVAGNEIDKSSTNVTVKDTTAPTVQADGVLYGGKKIVKILFSEPMATSGAGSVLDLANYQFGGTYLNTTKAKATITDSGKAVLIDYSETDLTISNNNTITVGKVADVTGNTTTNFTTTVTVKNAASVGINKVEAVDTKTVKVTLEDTLSKFDAKDFVLQIGGENAPAGTATSVSFANVDGKGVITYTLKEHLKTNATTDGTKQLAVKTADATIVSENAFGVKVQQNADAVAAADKIAAVVEKFNHDGDPITDEVYDVQVSFIDSNSNGKIDKDEEATFFVNYSEVLDANSISRLSFTVEGFNVKAVALGTDKSVVEITASALADNTDIKVALTQALDITDNSPAKNVVKGATYTVAKKK